VKPIHTITPAETSHVLHGVEWLGPIVTNSDELLHSLHLFVPLAEISIANGFPHKFRDAGLSIPGVSVQGIPEMIVEIKLGPPHDVYYTS
jgi:hypothetical protein